MQLSFLTSGRPDERRSVIEQLVRTHPEEFKGVYDPLSYERLIHDAFVALAPDRDPAHDYSDSQYRVGLATNDGSLTLNIRRIGDLTYPQEPSNE